MSDTSLVNWGLALMVARKRKNITQTEASKALGITRPYLSMVETNPTKASRELIEKAAEFYEIKMSELAALGESNG